MGMFDSVYIEEHACPGCGEAMDGELQTKDLNCILSRWDFPDYIPSVEPEEVRKIYLYDSCSKCRWSADWVGMVKNQVLYYLIPPKETGLPIREVNPTDELRDSLKKIQYLDSEANHLKSLIIGISVYIWKTHPELRDNLFTILKEELSLSKENFEKYSARSCLNPLSYFGGIIGGPQNYYWKLIGKSWEECKKDLEKANKKLKTLPVGPERTKLVNDIEPEI